MDPHATVSRPNHQARFLLLGAALLALVSLSLPWGQSGQSESTYVPGWYTPGLCTTVYDYDGWASVDCTGSYLSPGYVMAGTGASTPGRALGVRVFLVGGIALVAVARWQRARNLLRFSPLIIGGGLLLTGGVGNGVGFVTALLALALLVMALRREGTLNGPRRHRLVAQ